MSTLIIEGTRRLSGSVEVGGNKNAALPLLAACLLTTKECVLTNVPEIGDVEVMARLGFSMLVIMQNEWPKAAADIHRFNALAAAEGYQPRPPMILTNVSVAESRAEAQERAIEYLGRKWDSIDSHYHFSDGHLTADVTLSGPVRDLRADGFAELTAEHFELAATHVPWEDVAVRVEARGSALEVTTLRARGGDGTLSGEGRIAVAAPGGDLSDHIAKHRRLTGVILVRVPVAAVHHHP